MSRESRQRRRAEAAAAGRRKQLRRFRWLLIIPLVIAAGVFVWRGSLPHFARSGMPTTSDSGFKPPTDYAELCALSTNDLQRCDIALMNLLCAQGLRGAESLDPQKLLAELDEIAKGIKYETERNIHKYREKPEEFQHSEGYYRTMMMVTVLQQDYQIHYNPERITQPGEAIESDQQFFADSRDVFINGLIRQGGTGTCSSMPVFLVAVGRRLGYPLKLVKAKGHLFARWDEGSRSFNIEGTSIGFVSHTDAEYRTWPAPFTPEEEKVEGYLKALTPAQELAVFLSIRGSCLRAAGQYKFALGAYAQAFYRQPESVGYQKLYVRAEREAAKAGCLPEAQALLAELRQWSAPDGPMRQYFGQHKVVLQMRLMTGEAPGEVSRDFTLLRQEAMAYQQRLASSSTASVNLPGDANTTNTVKTALQYAPTGVSPSSR